MLHLGTILLTKHSPPRAIAFFGTGAFSIFLIKNTGDKAILGSM